jgi:hypothetical protein
MKMTSNGKTLNYKVVDLVESYNFYIKFTSIRVQTKKYKFLKRDCTPTAMAHGGRMCYSTARLLLPWGTALDPNAVPHGAKCIVLYIFWIIYFCKKRKKNVKKEKIPL